MEESCKGATAKEKDNDVWPNINLMYIGAKLSNELFPISSNNVELDVFKSSPHLQRFYIQLFHAF